MTAGDDTRAGRRRAHRRRRSTRTLAAVAAFLAVAFVLWIWVFPWLDRTFVNRPAIGG